MRPLWPFLLIYFICPIFGDDCSGTVEIQATETPKFITTPNYAPNSTYPPFLDCLFVIKAPDKQRISVEILDLKMETKLFSSCVDYVAIYEGFPDNNESSVTQFCEEAKNRQIVSMSNQVVIQFKSDDLYQYAGANISVQSIGFHECPAGWLDMFNETCVKLSHPDQKTNWLTAQYRCLEQKSNLLMIESDDEFSFIYNNFNLVPSNMWIGYHDGDMETRIDGIDQTTRYPNHRHRDQFQVRDNNDENDCLSLDFVNDIHYKMDKCSIPHMYICSMKKDWNTTLYPVPEEELREGLKSKSNQYSLWVLLFIIGVLFLIILAFLCFMCWKQKDGNRVHDQTSTIQQNAFMNDAHQQAAAPISQPQTTISPVPVIQQQQQQNQVPTVSGSMPNSSRVIEKVPMIRSAEKNRKQFPVAVGPKKVPMSEENSGETNGLETNIMAPSVSNEPEHLVPATKPRTLPPMMPTREGTFQSMNTRDGSTMRTRRNRELFDRPVMHVLDNVSAISLDEFWSNKKPT